MNSLINPLKVLEGAIKASLFSRLNSPNSLSQSSQEKCSMPLITFIDLFRAHSKRSMSFACSIFYFWVFWLIVDLMKWLKHWQWHALVYVWFVYFLVFIGMFSLWLSAFYATSFNKNSNKNIQMSCSGFLNQVLWPL